MIFFQIANTSLIYFRLLSFEKNRLKKICFLIPTFLILFNANNTKAQLSYTFTNAGNTGSIGPTQVQVNANYSLGTLSGAVTVSAGIQSWTIPVSGLYLIEVYGAGGGEAPDNLKIGGFGAIMRGQFNLTAGGLLQVLVGQRGLTTSNVGGGGGGTFVIYNGTLIMVAGGGGGASYDMNGAHGTTLTSGSMCALNVVSGGASGSGGLACLIPLGTANAGGGGGYLAGITGNGTSASAGGWGGTSFLNGGIGGAAFQTFANNGCSGGFGGGGGVRSMGGGGGGGGYSGGGGGQNLNNCAVGQRSGGGGGGSYNIGMLQNNTLGFQQTDGKVVLTYLCGTITLSSTSNPICVGSSATLTTNAIGNYTWSTGSNASSIIVSPTTTTTYSVMGQTGSNCLSANLITLSVTSQPSVSISTINSSACVGSGLVLTANGLGGTAPYSFTWTSGPQSNTYSVSHPAGNYTHSVVLSDASNCTANNTIAVTFINPPVLLTNNASICQGSFATLIVSGANSYTWNPSGIIGTSITVSPASAFNYTVIGTAATGCTASTSVFVNVTLPPTLTVSNTGITCATLGSATVSALSGIGPYSYTWTPTSQNSSVATGLNPNTYTLTVFDAGSGCTSTTSSMFTSPLPFTGNLITSSITCNSALNGTASFSTISGGSGNQNYLWSNGLSTYTSPVTTSLSAGQWSVTVTDALTACQINSVFTITQPPALTLTIAQSSPTVCLGSTVTLTATGSGGTPLGTGYTYNWVSVSNGSLLTTTVNALGNTTFTVNISDSNGCLSTQTTVIAGIANPTIVVSSVSICPLETGTMVASGANSYTWLPAGVIGNFFSQAPLSSQQYSVIGSAQSCTALATSSIIIKSLPSVNIVVSNPLCTNSPIFLSASGGTAYSWMGPQNFTSQLQSPVINFATINQSGNYSVTVTSANSCTAMASQNLSINPTPTLSVSGSTVCSTQNMSLSAISFSGAGYQWSGPNGFNCYAQYTTVVAPTSSQSGVYTVTVTSLQNCTNTASALVNITNAPQVNISMSSPVCINGSITFSASGGVIYSWNGPNSFTSALQNPVLSNLNFSNSGTYTLTAITGPCTLQAFQNVTVHSLPNISAGYNSPLCEFKNLILNAASAATYSWAGPQNFSSSIQNPTLNTVSISNSGNYSLMISDAFGCSSGTVMPVYVLPAPLAGTSSASVCAGGLAVLTVTGGVSYVWSGPLGFSSISNSLSFYPSSLNQSGTYSVVVTGSNSCTKTLTTQLSVFNFALPVPQISATPSVCVNSNIYLNGSGGIAYTWTGPEGFVSTSPNMTIVASHVGMSGTYTLAVTNSSFCTSTSTVFIKIFDLPHASLLSSKNELCVPFCTDFNFHASSSTAPIVSSYYLIEGISYQSASIQACINWPDSHPAFVYYKDINGCSNTSTLLITGYEKPKAAFSFFPTKPVAGLDMVQFSSQSTGNQINNYTWIMYNGDSTISEHTSHLFEEAGEYPMVLVAENTWGCADTVIQLVKVEEDFALYIPNAFTPNGDGLNDVFKASGSGIQEYKMEIYSRWGVKVFDSNTVQNGWDGYYQGVLSNPGIYTWKITYSTTGRKVSERNGFVMLEK